MHTRNTMTYYDDVLNQSIEVTLCKRRVLISRLIAAMEDTRLPVCLMAEEPSGGLVSTGGQEGEWVRCHMDDLSYWYLKMVLNTEDKPS